VSEPYRIDTLKDRSAARKLSRREERSGLPSGSIYWHFESKEALLGEVVEEGARRWFDSVLAIGDLPSDPDARAAALLDAAATSLEKQPEFLRLLILIALERREVDKVSVAVIRRVRARALQQVRRLVSPLLTGFDAERADRLAGEFARLVLCVADGAFVANQIDPRHTDIRALFDLMRRALAALARELLEPSHGGVS